RPRHGLRPTGDGEAPFVERCVRRRTGGENGKVVRHVLAGRKTSAVVPAPATSKATRDDAHEPDRTPVRRTTSTKAGAEAQLPLRRTDPCADGRGPPVHGRKRTTAQHH